MKVGKQKLSMSESYKVRVDPSGPRDALVVFVGDAPAKEDIYQNAPFSGVDGEHLTNCCRLAGIDRRKVYITTLSKYRVKADKMANVPPEDIISMGQKMMEEINELPNVRIIVPLGKYALSTLTNKSGITNFRGSPLPPALGIRHDCVVVPTFHPGHLNAVYKDWVLMVADLTKVRRIMDNNYQFNWPKYEFILRPSYGEVMDTISMIKNLKPEFIAVDVETPKNLLSCIGIAWDRQNALCIPTMYGNGNSYWKIENEMKIWRALDDLFQTVPIGNQNIMFDWRILCQHGFQPMKAIKEGMLIRDPMLMHHCLYSEMRHGLDVIVSIYTDLPFFKKDEEEKKGSALIAGKETEHWTYNSMDCIGAYWAIEELEKELIDENMFDTYKNLYSDMIPVLFEMNMRGVPVDINYLETIRRESTELVSQYNARIKELTGEIEH